MIVHTMTNAEMIADARKDFPAIGNRIKPLVREARRDMIRTRKDRLIMTEWRSPRKNNWLLLVIHRKAGPRLYALTWYLDRDKRINAFIMAHEGMVYRISRHVIERYGERFDPTANPLQRLRNFFQENYSYSAECTEQVGEDRFKVQVGMCHGMGLGEWDRKEGLVYINTFVNHGQLFQNQADSMERMDFERLLHQLSASQRRHLVALYKRKYPEDVGKPGMEWLERFAA